MVVINMYQGDVNLILSKRYDNGNDYWTTPDRRIGKGSPFSALECALMLTELGMKPSTSILKETAKLIFDTWQDDGRFKIAPQGAIYPCHTAGVAHTLCRLGYATDSRLSKTFTHLLAIQHQDGGWKCNTYKYGRGPETEYSNPGPTLAALDAFRYTPYFNQDTRLDKAVEFLLNHWVIKKPLGPCRYGIGSLFMQVEFPFFRYNIFFYIYVLSFYKKAKKDKRFLQAVKVLESKSVNGKMVVENPNRKLAGLSFCKKGHPSEIATVRYTEIIHNLR